MAIRTKNYTFNIPGNFTYDNTLVQVSGGNSKLLDLRPNNSTFYSNYQINENGNWGNGVLTGTLGGNAFIDSGFLKFTNTLGDECTYSAVGNANNPQTGTYRIRIQPQYTGNPATTQVFIATSSSLAIESACGVTHQITGQLRLLAYDENNVNFSVDIGIWNPTAGTTYEIELNYDFTGGVQRIFIDGIQFGATQNIIMTRDQTEIDTLRIDGGIIGAQTPNFWVEDVIVFSTVQHTANYTPDWTNIPSTIYSLTNPTIKNTSVINADSINSIAVTSTITGSDLIQLVIEVDGINKYWNGSAWSTSTGYAQSNTITEINNNISTLLSDTAEIRIILYLHSDDGNTTPVVSNLTINYNYIEIIVGTNSWVTLNYANNYFDEKYNSTWDDLTTIIKKRLLISAYRWIQQQTFFSIPASSTLEIVKQAQCEAAWFMYIFWDEYEKRRNLSASGVKSFRISKFSETLNRVEFPQFLKDMLEDFIIDEGGIFPVIEREFESNQSI